MAVYTKTGDKGRTKVFNKKSGKLVQVSKGSCKIRSIGSIDELNSFLGIIISESKNKVFNGNLRRVQGNLFTVNSILAGSNLSLPSNETKYLEKEIDEIEGSLPVLKNFIYYGGNKISSMVFYARALCRKAERSLVVFVKQNPQQEISTVLTYINRLSDYLFMLGRKVNFDNKKREEYWIGSVKK